MSSIPTKKFRKRDERVGGGAENTSPTPPKNSCVTTEMVATGATLDPNEQQKLQPFLQPSIYSTKTRKYGTKVARVIAQKKGKMIW